MQLVNAIFKLAPSLMYLIQDTNTHAMKKSLVLCPVCVDKNQQCDELVFLPLSFFNFKLTCFTFSLDRKCSKILLKFKSN